ncbi:MAG: LCP family protein [Actinophytocola sp.]|uniref:LCP family protein n=1 Tax=Actinophytocola sp. TaxID=1872138 RepID=UPI003D6A4396
MNADNTEQLIRDAFAAEADRAVDSRTVLAELRRAGRPRRPRMGLLAAASAVVVVVVVAVGAVVLPKASNSGAPSAGEAPAKDQNVLLVGLDESENADAIMLAHLDADGSANVLSLPRDSWVEVPDRGRERLGQVYPLHGIDPLLATVHTLTGVRPDHYALVEMAGFGGLASAVGGVRVCLRQPSRDPRSGASFPAGPQVLSGKAALAFVRQRTNLDDGDLDRIVRQQAFLRAVATAVRDDPNGLAALLAIVRHHVTPDPGWDIVGLAEQLQALRLDALRFETIPVADETHLVPNAGAVLLVNPAAVRAHVEDVFGPDHAATADPGAGASRGSLPAGQQPCVD